MWKLFGGARKDGISRKVRSTEFQVAKVTPCMTRLGALELGPALEQVTQTKLRICPDTTRKVLPGIDFHPLIAAAVVAFRQHYPLVLSPDMIWLTVLQGVSQHIQNHSGKLRSRLVQHQTKIELVITVHRLPRENSEMQAMAKAFCDAIAQHLQPGKRPLLEARFSTTTEVDQIAASAVLMEALQPYFDYVAICICGIPSVILEGTVADWELLEQKVRALHESGLELEWWTGHLLPLCRQFSQAAAGDVDLDHWRDICKVMRAYAKDDFNGWLLKFIPYVRGGHNQPFTERNPVLERIPDQSQGALDPLSRKPGDKPAAVSENEFASLLRRQRQVRARCSSDMLPTGISSIPIKVLEPESNEPSIHRFLAGFVGVEQSPLKLSLRPITGWAVAEPTLIDLLIHKLQLGHGCGSPKTAAAESVLGSLAFSGLRIPSELWKFYTEIDEVTVCFQQPNRWGETVCHILPLEGIERMITFDGRKLLRVAQADEGEQGPSYIYGVVPPDEEPGVYRWTGERCPEAFTRVANSFLEWLNGVLKESRPESGRQTS